MTLNAELGEPKLGRGSGNTARGMIAAVLRPIGFVVSPVLRAVATLAVGLFSTAAVLVGLADVFAAVLFHWAHPSHYPFLVTFAMMGVLLRARSGCPSHPRQPLNRREATPSPPVADLRAPLLTTPLARDMTLAQPTKRTALVKRTR